MPRRKGHDSGFNDFNGDGYSFEGIFQQNIWKKKSEFLFFFVFRKLEIDAVLNGKGSLIMKALSSCLFSISNY